jgi:maleylacetoacetate isomerase/maleylpyruvate isomerase
MSALPRLYSYFRSSSAYRVRIALNWKGIAYETVPTHLLRGGGEHRSPAYLERNPQGLVPALETDGRVLGQSLAIIEYLEETYPEPPLLPPAAADRATVRAMALGIGCDIQPLNNLRVLQYLREELAQDQAAIDRWYAHWIGCGFAGLEALVRRHSDEGRYCFGDAVTLADVCLVPQMYNARRFRCDVETFPLLGAISSHLETLEPFRAARPETQPDAE